VGRAGGRPGDAALTRGERAEVVALYAAIAVVTGATFALTFAIGRSWPIFAGLGVTAFVLGLRHGADADHISAIDNTTRKLLQDGRRPLTVGTWFSLGHSTVVVGLIVLLVAATGYVQDRLAAFRAIGAPIGLGVSGAFLLLIGLLNLVIAREVYRLFRGVRDGRLDEAELERQLTQRGLFARYFGRWFRFIERPWQIYPIGLLFGLGFDTASEIALIGLSVTVGVTASVPLLAVLTLPMLFLCGMVIVDTTDGVAMRYAYGWAFAHPLRKIYYNLTLTVISVLVAFAVGGLELLGVAAGALGLGGAFWGAVANLDFFTVGYAVVAVFLGVWAIALVVYRWKRYDRAAPAAIPSAGREPDTAVQPAEPP
jgi:nickel/cobalt transporter (NiCoT) family protein